MEIEMQNRRYVVFNISNAGALRAAGMRNLFVVNQEPFDWDGQPRTGLQINDDSMGWSHRKPIDMKNLMSCDEIVITCDCTQDCCIACLIDMLFFMRRIAEQFSDTNIQFYLMLYQYRKRPFRQFKFSVSDLQRIPALTQENFMRYANTNPKTSDRLPVYTDFSAWIQLIYQKVATELTRYFVYPEINSGLTFTQQSMLKYKNVILDAGSFNKYAHFTRIWMYYYGQLKIFRDLYIDVTNPKGKRFGKPCGKRRTCPLWNKGECLPFINDKVFYYPSQDYDTAIPFCRKCFIPLKRFPLNEFGRDLIAWETGRPSIIPRATWESNKWQFSMAERRPLFPLLLWHGYHGKALELESYFPPHNFHDVVNALHCAIDGKTLPTLRSEAEYCDESKQILWDGKCFRKYATTELIEYYAKQLVKDFSGNADCALFYLNALLEKYPAL